MEHNTHTGVPSSRDTSGVSGRRRLRKRSGKKENMVISYHQRGEGRGGKGRGRERGEGGRGKGWRLKNVSRVAIKSTNNNVLIISPIPKSLVVN